MRAAVPPHRPLLVCLKLEIRARAAGTQQHKSGRAIFREIGRRRRLIDVSLNQSGRAGQTPALMADRGQGNTRARGGVPDKFVFPAIDGAGSFRSRENDPEGKAVTDCRNPDSCYRAPRPARHAGSVRTGRTCHRARGPAIR